MTSADIAEGTITRALASFTFGPLPTRTVFGPRSIRVLPQETERAGFTRVILLSTPRGAGLAGELAGSLPGMAAGVHDGATMHIGAFLPKLEERPSRLRRRWALGSSDRRSRLHRRDADSAIRRCGGWRDQARSATSGGPLPPRCQRHLNPDPLTAPAF